MNKKKIKKKGSAKYVWGSIVLFTIACATIPTMLSKVTGLLYRATVDSYKDDDNDWGPVIEKKGENKDGN